MIVKEAKVDRKSEASFSRFHTPPPISWGAEVPRLQEGSRDSSLTCKPSALNPTACHLHSSPGVFFHHSLSHRLPESSMDPARLRLSEGGDHMASCCP